MLFRSTTKAEMNEIIRLIKRTGAIEESYAISQRYLQKALDILATLPSNQAKKYFMNIAKRIGKRKY